MLCFEIVVRKDGATFWLTLVLRNSTRNQLLIEVVRWLLRESGYKISQTDKLSVTSSLSEEKLVIESAHGLIALNELANIVSSITRQAAVTTSTGCMHHVCSEDLPRGALKFTARLWSAHAELRRSNNGTRTAWPTHMLN